VNSNLPLDPKTTVRLHGKDAIADENVENNENSTEKLPGGITGKGFIPGQSGNPGGRPKKKPVTEIYEELLADPEVRHAIKEAIRGRLMSTRMVGSLEAKEMADRVEGKVSQPLEGEFNLNVSLADRMQKARDRVKE
jgi:Family of unknown function (DUF5681)